MPRECPRSFYLAVKVGEIETDPIQKLCALPEDGGWRQTLFAWLAAVCKLCYVVEVDEVGIRRGRTTTFELQDNVLQTRLSYAGRIAATPPGRLFRPFDALHLVRSCCPPLVHNSL